LAIKIAVSAQFTAQNDAPKRFLSSFLNTRSENSARKSAKEKSGEIERIGDWAYLHE